jgi:Domain of unknown function (DUF4360)
MKLIKVLLVLATLITAPIAPALANSRIEILQASYGGNGCPAGSANVAVSPDGQELNFLFDNFIALGNIATESRKSCNISIPIKVPAGFQVSIDDMDYQGYVAPGTKGILRSEYFFAGSRGPVFKRTFDGEINYSVRDSISSSPNAWSTCGESVNMRLNISMTAIGAGKATIDKSPQFHFKYRSCNSDNPPVNPQENPPNQSPQIIRRG